MKNRPDLARARWRLWASTFVVMGALTSALIFLATNEDQAVKNDLLPSRGALIFGLVAALAAFLLYVIDAERKLRRLAEELFQQRLERERLAEREAIQRDFVSVVAHELRSPLSAIKGFARTLLLRSDSLSPEKRTQYLALINEQSDRLARLVNDLTEVSRIDTGRVKLEPTQTDVPALVKKLVDEFRTKWSDRDITVHSDDDAPPAFADPHRVEEILINLIENAMKYTPVGAPVDIEIRRDGDELAVSVRDHGAGISPEDAARVFEKFTRLGGEASDGVQGSGLGLYIVKGLVDAHDGRVWVEQANGSGARFTFTLPTVR